MICSAGDLHNDDILIKTETYSGKEGLHHTYSNHLLKKKSPLLPNMPAQVISPFQYTHFCASDTI